MRRSSAGPKIWVALYSQVGVPLGHGEKYLPIIGEVFKRMRPEVDFEKEKMQYLARMKTVRSLLGKA